VFDILRLLPIGDTIKCRSPTKRPASADRTARRQFQATDQPLETVSRPRRRDRDYIPGLGHPR